MTELALRSLYFFWGRRNEIGSSWSSACTYWNVRKCIFRFQWWKIMGVFGKENCILKVVTLTTYLVKTASGDSRLWKESNRMQVVSILPSLVLPLFFSLDQHHLCILEIVQHCFTSCLWFFGFLFVGFVFLVFVFSNPETSVHTRMFYYLKYLFSRYMLVVWHKRFSVESWFPTLLSSSSV